MVSLTLFSEKGLKVLSRSASAAASRLAIMGSKENQHKLFEWTHSEATLSQQKQSDFIDIGEDKFIDEILDFDNDLCKRTFFMVSPQGTGKSELCLCVKHAYEKKFVSKGYPPVLYIQRDAPAIRYLNKKSEMSKWLKDEIDEEILSVFKREDRSEETLMKILNDNNYDAVYESIASRIKFETGLKPFSKELSSDLYVDLKGILEENLKYYLAAQFPNNEGASEISNQVSPRSKFFDPKDNNPTSEYRIYAQTLHEFFGGSVTKAKVYELLNSAVEGSLGGSSTHLADIIGHIGTIARARGQHLLVINEDFYEDRNSTSTEKFSNLVISDMSPNEDEKTNITLLFAGLKKGIDGLRSISHTKTGRVTGEFRTAKDEEEGSASLVIQNPVEFARKYILWAKRDEGLIKDYNLEPSKSIPSPDKSYKEWGNLSSLNQQLFPLSDHSIEFIWDHLINQNPRGFIDFIRRLLDKSLCPEKTNPASRIQDLHDSDLKTDWGTSVGDAFRDSVSYIFHFMYGHDNQAKSYRKIFKIDKWEETNEIRDISSLDSPPLDPLQPVDTIQELMNKWNLGGADKESILPKVHELEYTVWKSVLSTFFNYNGGINYEHPYLKKRLLTRNFDFIKSRSNTAHNSTFTEWGLNLDDYAPNYLEDITKYRLTVITIGKYLEDNRGKWPELGEYQDVVSEIVEIISHYTKNIQQKLQLKIKFEDLENMLMSFKIFEGMWRSLFNREKISFTPKADEVEARFNKSWKMRTVGILDQLENSLASYPEMGQVKTKAKDLNKSVEDLKQRAVDETDLIAEIFSYRVRDDIWWKSFSSTSGWSRSLTLSHWSLNQNIDNWNIFANRRGSAKGQLSFWYLFHIRFSSQWFTATQVPAQDITRNIRILFDNYELIKEDKDNLESTIQSLQGSEEQVIKNKWDTIKNLDLDFIINKTTRSYMLDERGLTNKDGIKFLVSYIYSLEESDSLFNFWNYCKAASLNKQKLDPRSQDVILQSWDERRKNLSKGQSISFDLNEIIVPDESENQDIIRLTSLLSLIKDGEKSLEEIKKKILLCHISEILFDKDVKQKDLSSTLDYSEDEFDEDELIKYARVLASFQFDTEGKLIDTYDELPDSKSKLKILNKIDSSNLENVTETERFFFEVQIFHNHFRDNNANEALWSKALNAVFNDKTLLDMPQSQLKELRDEYGDVLTLEFKKSR